MLHRLRAVYHTSARGDNTSILFKTAVDFIFHSKKAVQPLLGDDLMEQLSRFFLDDQIGIQKAAAHMLGKDHSHRALSRPRHSDQDNVLISAHAQFSSAAMTSTSQSTFLGSAFTATQLLAGFSVKYFSYTPLKAAKSAISARKQVVFTTLA